VEREHPAERCDGQDSAEPHDAVPAVRRRGEIDRQEEFAGREREGEKKAPERSAVSRLGNEFAAFAVIAPAPVRGAQREPRAEADEQSGDDPVKRGVVAFVDLPSKAGERDTERRGRENVPPARECDGAERATLRPAARAADHDERQPVLGNGRMEGGDAEVGCGEREEERAQARMVSR